MNIYLISQEKNNDYDTYDSAVVIAEDSEKAQMTHPDGSKEWDGKDKRWSSWCEAASVDVELIGTASDGAEIGVVCASFNAG